MENIRNLSFRSTYSREPLLLLGESPGGAELYKLIDFEAGTVRDIEIDISDFRDRQRAVIDEHLGGAEPPYGLTSLDSLVAYFLAPHTFVETGGEILVSMKQAPYVRRLSLTGGESPTWPAAEDVDFGVMLSSSNCEVEPGVVGFGAQSATDRLRRYLDPGQEISCRIGNYDLESGKHTEVQGLPSFVVDSFHELNYSPAGYYVGVDMNLSVDAGHDGRVAGFANGVLDVATYCAENPFQHAKFCVVEPGADGTAARATVGTPATAGAAHIDFDLRDASVFYISCHNISKWQNQVVIHGPGRLEKYRYHDGVVERLGSFTEPEFLRITSQVPFMADGRHFIAITCYPNHMYVIDTDTMTPYRRIKLFDAEPVSTPMACPKNGAIPLYLALSEDRRYAFLTGAAVLYVVDLVAGEVVDEVPFCEPGTFIASAHTALVTQASH